MMNPYVILTALLVWLGSLAGVGWWQHNAGRNAQIAADQLQFDRINAQINEQKTIANNTYRTAQATIIATLAERDKFKTQLEKDHAKNQAATDALRRKYADVGLRFPAAQGSGCGAGSPSPLPAVAGAASIDAAAVCVVSDAVDAALKSIVFDADQLADEYQKCYGYATQVK